MASRASTFNIDGHKLFDVIKKSLPEKITKTLNIVHCKDDVLYVWHSAENCILTLNVKTFEIEENADFQRLMPTETPSFAVEQLSANPLSTILCASGTKGVCVLRLPRRSGALSLFQGGRPTVLCKSQMLDERLFLTQCEIYQVSWHPGSTSDSHLLILASDNTFRLYDLSSSSSVQIRTIPLGRKVTPTLPLPSVLGESTVGFTFGRPSTRHEQGDAGFKVQWPTLLLRGNGDVCIIDVSIDADRSFPPKLLGPLPMYPPADDNYGVESCSILVLGGHLVCIATCGGTLYHCVLLPDEQDSDKFVSSNENTLQGHSLYVIEAIELDLGLSLSDSDPSYSCPIYLIPDEGVKNRYFCSHETGMHIITVPAVNQLEAFYNGDDDNIENLLPTLNQPSTAEYAVCTKTCKSTGVNPPIGLTVCYSPHMVLTVLSKGDVINRSLSSEPNSELLFMDNQLSKERSIVQSELSTSLKELQKVSFDTHIRQVLRHELSQPILKMGTQAEPQPQECFELLTHATHVFHEEFFSKLEKARKELERRVNTLRLLKVHQLSEVQEVRRGREETETENCRMRNKCNAMVMHQQELNRRCSQVLRAIRKKHSVASIAEKDMAEELRQAETKTKFFGKQFENVKRKIQFRETQMQEWDSNKLKKEVFLGKNHTEIIKSTVEKQTGQIKEIIQHINNLKAELNVI